LRTSQAFVRIGQEIALDTLGASAVLTSKISAELRTARSLDAGDFRYTSSTN